jgi:pimeloyl-ACP methyl ester carboxylesterase
VTDSTDGRRKPLLILLGVIVAVVSAIIGVRSTDTVIAPVAPAPTARGLVCGAFEFPTCDGSDAQFDAAFDAPQNADGFGGGRCQATRTPVVFVHGNADRSINWDSGITGPVGANPEPARSVYDEFTGRGYNGCELFGITFLTEAEQRDPQLNYHKPEKYRQILDFIAQVKEFTGAPKVDVVAHSLGVSMTLAALTWHDETADDPGGWDSVRRFVNIAGGLHGLSACRGVGFANPLVSTCGSQNILDPYVFGFYPDGNGWTAASGEHSMRAMPARHPDVAFYTIHAGSHDEVHCGLVTDLGADCGQGALFSDGANVEAQLDVGAGSTVTQVDLDMADGSLFTVRGGDVDGVGHYKSKNNTGQISYQMLNSDCAGIACQGSYVGGPVSAS